MELSEGTSHQQTLHGLRPFTVYSVGVEACTCFLCCSRGPLSELRTQASAPAHQSPPRPVALTSSSALVEWDMPLQPNGIIERCISHRKIFILHDNIITYFESVVLIVKAEVLVLQFHVLPLISKKLPTTR